MIFPQWVALSNLPLEYRDPPLVEIIANKLGIFVKNDLILFFWPHLVVNVCILS